MADLNKVFLIGRLTHDPELRYTPGGAPVTDLRLATSRVLSGGDEGERREKETLYIDVTVWNRQAENCCQYLTKGSQVHVEGFLRMDSWEDKTSGEKRTKIKVIALGVQFLDSRGRRDDSAPSRDEDAPAHASIDRRAPDSRPAPGPAPAPAATPRPVPTAPAPTPAAKRPPREPDPAEAEDDIPF